MTCREKLAMEHPEYINERFTGGCAGCPSEYGYLPKPKDCGNCTECWNREIPNTNIPWDKIREMINDAMEKRDRTVSVYFNPETGMSLNVYPWPDADDLYDMYQKGRITANDFRAKMCLPAVKNPEKFMKRGFLNTEFTIPTGVQYMTISIGDNIFLKSTNASSSVKSCRHF